MADRVLRTDWKRIGRSGATVDGREISPQMIDEMAASYNKELYTAEIWPEHQRYVNYGTVEALRATDNEEGGRDLWAVISPNALYLNANQYGQKLFTSMEITPKFRKTGKAYLTGLGATDDPASAATSEIRFSKVADLGGIILTKAVENIDQTFENPAQTNLLDQIKALFKNQPNEDDDMATKAALQQFSTELAALKELFAKALPATDDKKPDEKPDDLATQFAALKQSQEELLQKFNASKPAEENPAADALKTLQERFSALEQKLADALKEQPGTDGGEHFNADDKGKCL
jgi:hypothetical protein